MPPAGFPLYIIYIIDMKVLVATEKPFSQVAVDGIKEVINEAGGQVALLEKYTEKSQLLNANSVAELVFGLLVYAVRNFYNGTSGTELMGKKLGILAFGNVGRNVARIAKGFGMEVYAYDAFCPKEAIEAAGVHAAASRDELFEQCDIVSLHIPATPETRQSINHDLVNKMKKGGILVNTARKEVIDEPGLIALMQERGDLKYITDIKPDADATFSSEFQGRYFATPKKMGAQTAEANVNAGIAAARQIVAYLKDGVTKFQVNK